MRNGERRSRVITEDRIHGTVFLNLDHLTPYRGPVWGRTGRSEDPVTVEETQVEDSDEGVPLSGPESTRLTHVVPD